MLFFCIFLAMLSGSLVPSLRIEETDLTHLGGGVQPRIYWINSRGQLTRGGPQACRLVKN
jgi:hypothetical protein